MRLLHMALDCGSEVLHYFHPAIGMWSRQNFSKYYKDQCFVDKRKVISFCFRQRPDIYCAHHEIAKMRYTPAFFYLGQIGPAQGKKINLGRV